MLQVSVISQASWQARLVDLTQKVPDDTFPSAKVAPLLESARAFCRLQEAKRKLQKQRDEDLSAEECSSARFEPRLVALYDSELQAADDLLTTQSVVLEQELLVFHRSVEDGRLDHLDSATADGRDALLELTPGVGGQVVTAATAPTEAKEEETMEIKEAFAPLNSTQETEESKPEQQEQETKQPPPDLSEKSPEIKVVPAPAAEPKTSSAASSIFVVKVNKEGGKLGGLLDTSQDECCVFKRVDSGGVLHKAGVRLYDRLIKVNGQAKSSSQLADLIGASNELQLEVEHPKTEAVQLNKAGKKVGLRLQAEDACFGLIVKEVTGGVAAEMPKGTFQPKSRIVEVDGQSAKPSDMLKQISTKDTVSLKVCSYSI
ncbi:prfA [Symbiodinium pilosum]|uniref:PrfA protein n=1 Tax=Symbiodinium pilosum TaxID=2952 RepID=A0A812XUE7_SYMPI|nr:prfA [Symbiodinium pilosum]